MTSKAEVTLVLTEERFHEILRILNAVSASHTVFGLDRVIDDLMFAQVEDDEQGIDG